jgi:hypothetical protein
MHDLDDQALGQREESQFLPVSGWDCAPRRRQVVGSGVVADLREHAVLETLDRVDAVEVGDLDGEASAGY